MLDFGRAPGQCADQLHAGRTVADDADAAAVQRYAVIPAGTVEHRSLEIIQAWNGGQAGVVQHAGGRYHDVGFIVQAAFHVEMPTAVLEFATDDFFVEANHFVDIVFFCGTFEVILHFGAGRHQVAPVRIRFERIGIGVGRYVAGQAGIGVFAPGTADPGRLFIDDGVAVTCLPQLDAAQDAGHTRSHHHYPKIVTLCCLAGHHSFLYCLLI